MAMLQGNMGQLRPTPRMQRILRVNDTEKPIRELRASLLTDGHEVVAEVTSTGALLKVVETLQPAVVILDVDSPSWDTLGQLAMMHHHAPRPVVMFAAAPNVQLIRAAVSAGVSAYSVSIINGVSAGFAAALGLSLTHRDHCHGVIFVTAHTHDHGEPDWAAVEALRARSRKR